MKKVVAVALMASLCGCSTTSEMLGGWWGEKAQEAPFAKTVPVKVKKCSQVAGLASLKASATPEELLAHLTDACVTDAQYATLMKHSQCRFDAYKDLKCNFTATSQAEYDALTDANRTLVTVHWRYVARSGFESFEVTAIDRYDSELYRKALADLRRDKACEVMDNGKKLVCKMMPTDAFKGNKTVKPVAYEPEPYVPEPEPVVEAPTTQEPDMYTKLENFVKKWF